LERELAKTEVAIVYLQVCLINPVTNLNRASNTYIRSYITHIYNLMYFVNVVRDLYVKVKKKAKLSP
jgi:hypothetical protein